MTVSRRVITSIESLGTMIRARRKELRMSQEELGQRIGVHQVTLSAIERGSARARLDTLLRVLSALDLELTLQTKGSNAQVDW
ncbi:MAG: transcriptional regulator [Leptospiraceae bacterium]|nr:transcriptional regulator [Leptospiraceae bacterium]MBR30820.1 transcriptional regulator [Spirochaetaceae bacterium]